jgi:hypothetical protein
MGSLDPELLDADHNVAGGIGEEMMILLQEALCLCSEEARRIPASSSGACPT